MSPYIHKKTLSKVKAARFFSYTKERYQILLNRRAGLPRNEWTSDPVLQNYRFTNVFREDDATTTYFRENIREPLRNSTAVIMATVACRWFNRINAMEVLQQFLLNDGWDQEKWRAALQKRKEQDGVIVTGAYIIKTPAKLSKIDALLQLIFHMKEHEGELIREINGCTTLEGAWRAIKKYPYQGEFTANEVVMDLYHTPFLEDAIDALSWSNPGPGCAAGLGALFFNDRQKFDRSKERDRETMINLMRELHEFSYDNNYWPQEWPKWTNLHVTEFNLCEYDKYLRGQKGMRLKRRYKERNDDQQDHVLSLRT